MQTYYVVVYMCAAEILARTREHNCIACPGLADPSIRPRQLLPKKLIVFDATPIEMQQNYGF